MAALLSLCPPPPWAWSYSRFLLLKREAFSVTVACSSWGSCRFLEVRGGEGEGNWVQPTLPWDGTHNWGFLEILLPPHPWLQFRRRLPPPPHSSFSFLSLIFNPWFVPSWCFLQVWQSNIEGLGCYVMSLFAEGCREDALNAAWASLSGP